MGVERSLNLKPTFFFKPKNESNQTHYETDPEHTVLKLYPYSMQILFIYNRHVYQFPLHHNEFWFDHKRNGQLKISVKRPLRPL